jgi:hypothetical protein
MEPFVEQASVAVGALEYIVLSLWLLWWSWFFGQHASVMRGAERVD